MGPANKPPAVEIAAHARALLASGATDHDSALRGLETIVGELRTNFNCEEHEVQPILDLIAELRKTIQQPSF
jgi:hypothetical protein